MKKNANNVGLLYPFVTSKVWKIMRISLLLLVVGLMHVSAASYSQTKKLNLRGNSFTLKEIFTAIEDQSTYTIFFKDDQVNLEQELSGNFNNQDITGVLDRALEGSNLTYKINDKLIIILENAPNMMQAAQQQDRSIKGKVVGQDGTSMPGVNVFVDGTTRGTITNIDGEFELNLEPGDATLVFSFIGYETQKVAIGERTNVNVTLMEESIGLDEVVAIGYGVQKKSDVTGSVASVKGDRLQRVTATNPAESLQGQMAGVTVSAIGGAPGAGMEIKIRGASTLNDNDPLVIIDGVPGSMYMLNSSDIESIEVLKDGASAAIYGTEAANGVIIITTKKGKEGKLTVDLEAKYGVQKIGNTLEMANAEEHLKIAKMTFDNAGKDRPQYLNDPIYYDTDWLDAVYRDAPIQEYTASIKGGSKNASYYLSAGWIDQDGTIIGTDFTKNNLRAKVDVTEGIFKAGLNMSYSETKNNKQTFYAQELYEILPLVPVFDDSKKSGYGYPDTERGMLANNNPVGKQELIDKYYTDQYVSAVGYASLDLFEGLNFRFEAGMNNSNRHEHESYPDYNVNNKEEKFYPYVGEKRENWREYNINNILSYQKRFEKHNLSLMAGYVIKKETSDWSNAYIEGVKEVHSVEDGKIKTDREPAGFLDPNFDTLDAGVGGTPSVDGSRYTYTRASILGRFNYSYNDRYLVQFTVRRDGSSKFGEDSRYGTFPSVALGWRMTEENFLSGVDWLSNLKLRGSYSIVGNEGSLGRYSRLPLMTRSVTHYLAYSRGLGGNIWPGTIARSIENKSYRWEETTTRNIGVDFGFFNNKLSGNLNYYSNITSDMLVSKPVPYSSGFKDPIVNIGEMSNSGVEIEIRYQNKIGELGYSVSANMSTVKNEVKKLGYKEQSIPGDGLNYNAHVAHKTKEGYALGSYWVYQTDGIFQTPEEVQAHHVIIDGKKKIIQENAKPGDIRFKDINKDGKLDEKDMVFSGVGIPKYDYSLSIDLDYKNFDFSMLWNGKGGHKLYNGNKYQYQSMLSPRNMLAECVNAWTPENTNTDIPRAVLADPNQNTRPSDRYLEDGDFIRLKNIQLGYTLPTVLTEKVNIQRARVYVSGQNLLTITNYSGQDPEIGSSGIWNPGLDITRYPISKMYLMGLQITF
ncbi:SusC/RagA family TonB-linked outer membrane protein [Marinilabiliaceae bacterium JC017]|nr:SusC/RagA family TonB-linked outer membrane protein [Marinilabiliaceae bacterium JC017]